MADRTVLGIDPGRSKCGLAVVRQPDRTIEHTIVARENLGQAVSEIAGRYTLEAIVVGDRTGSKDACTELRAHAPCPVVTVPEHESTLRARARYFRDNPPRGLMRLLPEGLRTPPRPVDDYAAVLLAEAYWERNR